MTHTEHDEGAARGTRKKQLAVAGLAVVLGSAAYLVTAQVAGDDDTVVRDTGALAPLTPAETATESPAASATPTGARPATSATSAPSAAKQSTSPTPAATRTRTRAEMIEEVKGTAAKANNVRRPLPQPATTVAGKDVTVTETGSLNKDGATLRVVSARADLTGQRELALVGDAGQPVGDARCTQSVRFTAGGTPVEKPSLMICWRTSAGRSVYTVAVVKQGRPSAETSVAAISKQWAKLS